MKLIPITLDQMNPALLDFDLSTSHGHGNSLDYDYLKAKHKYKNYSLVFAYYNDNLEYVTYCHINKEDMSYNKEDGWTHLVPIDVRLAVAAVFKNTIRAECL